MQNGHSNLEKTILMNSSAIMQEICEPLKLLGIVGFFYMRLYDDGSLTGLTSNPEWSDFFMTKFFTEGYEVCDIQDHIFVQDDISLWENNQHNIIWQEGKNYFNVGNGITITEKTKEYEEIFCFYSEVDNYIINQFYLRELPILKQFIAYFKESAAPLIHTAALERFQMPLKYMPPEIVKQNDEIKMFLSQVSSKGIRINLNNTHYYLTKRESECLYWLIKGKSAYEIGIILQCSQRTVEVHFARLKEKFDCTKLTSVVYQSLKLNLNELLTYYIDPDK